MAFHATLEIDNKTYDMLNWNMQVSQHIDSTGRPIANPEGGLITVTLKSTESNELFEWATSADMTKSGRMVFQRYDNDGSLKTYVFKNAYCIDFFEEFSSEGTTPMTIKITISAMELKNGNAGIEKNWDKTGAVQ
ncbi:MAG: hypothetical protein JXB34_02900 [Bacteroidales bacterium]|nr:hypothetical protein [Bacteroidales bacterium]